MTERKHVLRTLSALLLVTVCVAVQAANIYRYVDNNGRTVFNASIPPEYVKNGYTILNERGQVIEVVPPALTADQVAQQEAERRAREQEELARREQIEADNLLLRLYRSPEEVARKRDDRVRSLDSHIAGLNLNINSVGQDIASLEQRVATARQNGGEAPANLLRDLETLSAERERLQNQLDNANAEKANLIAQAEKDMARLRELLGQPEEPAAD